MRDTTVIDRHDFFFVLASGIAGGLAVPWQPVNTAIAAGVGLALAVSGLWARRWAQLVTGRGGSPSVRMAARVKESLAWFLAGLAVGLVLLGIIRLIIEPAVPAAGMRIEAAGHLPVWRRLVIIYVAAVGEELLFRVLLLSLIAGLIVRLTRAFREPASRVPTTGALAVATVLAALAFAAVHLPAWSNIGLTAGVMGTVIALNTLGGLVFGYAFVTRGILAAVCAHAGADCAIQLIGPLTGS